MNMKKNSARNALFQIVIFLLLIMSVVVFFKDELLYFYTASEVSTTGLILNGLILCLFMMGILQIVALLLRYSKEHQTLYRLVRLLKKEANEAIERLPSDALSVQRYRYVQWINQQGAPIDQAALASTLNANESSRLTLVRFVHSILILAGVFGTVVSLSLALVGASALLNSPEGAKEMGVIIGGMSSALSTTMTAIVCFIVYVYFYMRLNDVRIQLLSGIENATTLYMLPKINHSEAALIQQITTLSIALNQSAERMAQVEGDFISAGQQLQRSVNQLHQGLSQSGLDEISRLLREGFRLPAVTRANDITEKPRT